MSVNRTFGLSSSSSSSHPEDRSVGTKYLSTASAAEPDQEQANREAFLKKLPDIWNFLIDLENGKKTLEDEVSKLKADILSTKQESEKSKIQYIEVLGIFVALFTFVSLDFSLLKGGVNLGVSVSLILVAGGLLLAFLLLMHVILTKSSAKELWFFWLLVFFLTCAGIALLGYSLPTNLDRQDENMQNNINLEINNKLKK